MKQQWQQLAAKLDTRNQRERALIFFMVIVVVGSLVNALWIDPLLARKKKAMQEVMSQQEQLQTLSSQIQVIMSGGKPDPDAPFRVQLAGLEQKLSQSRAALQEVQQNLVPPDKMARLLEDVLTQNRKLKLVALKTLPVSDVLDMSEGVSNQSQAGQSKEELKSAAPAIYKHGVEITVSGNYAELTHYLDTLEKLPWRMFWGKAEMHVEEYPRVTLTITLYTLSMDKTWLNV
ncbi:MAG: type II secretion system protein M [Gammaproteobacteria bacterium]|nr:type II secretion system protein M [Gammaproteobacteria bacterium]MBU1733266.1 type II secretion system protein M [Gammaproteobacteria bacterium]MBU1892314.1 type II secretion system protein M [Gammaproteobacteria bacterium]